MDCTHKCQSCKDPCNRRFRGNRSLDGTDIRAVSDIDRPHVSAIKAELLAHLGEDTIDMLIKHRSWLTQLVK